jgi:pyridoxine 4-dehydrogenase
VRSASSSIAPWLLASSPVTLAIPGTGSLAHPEDNMATADIVLTEEDLA